jgi:hypothetical protein
MYSIDFTGTIEEDADDSLYEDVNLKLTERRDSECQYNGVRESQSLFHKMSLVQ